MSEKFKKNILIYAKHKIGTKKCKFARLSICKPETTNASVTSS